MTLLPADLPAFLEKAEGWVPGRWDTFPYDLYLMGYTTLIPVCRPIPGLEKRCCHHDGECPSAGKRPLVRWKYGSGGWGHPIDAETARRVWNPVTDDPEVVVPNAGLVTGEEAGVTVVDCDTPESLANVLPTLTRLNHAPLVVKTRRGFHFYFRYRKDCVSVVKDNLAGVDVSGDSHLVIAPGSTHAKGACYSAIHMVPRAQLPTISDELAELIVKRDRMVPSCGAPVGTTYVPVDHSPVAEGSRNYQLYRMVLSMVARGILSDAEITAVAHGINRQRCNPPLSEAEVAGVVANVLRSEVLKSRRAEWCFRYEF